ncbi:DUF4893 domain-containing protein [Luteolibacter sp. AS25]|uniref:DUF4893 domain-containing protein n=1 Tax=Luteolibacter sp. AS25 TaxID=3135776 RepID=UPI00398AB258
MRPLLIVAAIAAFSSLAYASPDETLSVLKPAEIKALATAEEGLKATVGNHISSQESDSAANAKEMEALLALPRLPLGDRLALAGKWKVRSLQVGNLGAYVYPFFPCEFRKVGKDGLLLLKDSGSQRRSGLVADDGKGNFVFIGGKYYSDEEPKGYSASQDEGTKVDTDRNSYGYLYRVGKNQLILIFGETTYGREMYEFKRGS